MGMFNFKKMKEVKLEVINTKNSNQLSYLKEDVSSKVKELNDEMYDEEESKKQMSVLIERLPITAEEKDFRDDLRRELYLLGYERECENGKEELADEVALTEIEVDIFKQINNDLSVGKIEQNQKIFLVKNILKLVNMSKAKIVHEKLCSELERREVKKVDIVEILNQMQTESQR